MKTKVEWVAGIDFKLYKTDNTYVIVMPKGYIESALRWREHEEVSIKRITATSTGDVVVILVEKKSKKAKKQV